MRKLLASLCALPFLVAAQGTIRGKITDGQTGESLIGASAFVEGTTMGAMADLDGNFNLTGLAPGTYSVTGRFIGCTPVTESVTITGDEVVIVNFNLLPETFVIEQAAEVVAKVDRTRDVTWRTSRRSRRPASTTSPASRSSAPGTAMRPAP